MMAEYFFHGDLSWLLRSKWQRKKPVIQQVTRSASIKDVIESFGVPHTEVGRIECQGIPVDFSHLVKPGQKFDVHPVPAPFDVTSPSSLRPAPLQNLRFIVDVNVGRLAKYIRLAGFDTAYDIDVRAPAIVRDLIQDPRVVITRDLSLLKRKEVVYGRYVRSVNPTEQLREVLQFFGIEKQVRPLTRCLECNSSLKPIEKDVIRHRLQPLTDKYYRRFSICTHCNKLYWAGSHVEKMMRSFKELWSGSTLSPDS